MATLGTFTAGQVLTAAELNQLNNVTVLRKTSDQSIPNSTTTEITFGAGTTIIDVSNWHSESVNTGRIVPSVAGFYLVTATAIFNSTTNAQYQIIIRKNGSIDLEAAIHTSDNFPAATTSTIAEANGSTDYFNMYVSQATGGSRNVFRSELSCILLRKT